MYSHASLLFACVLVLQGARSNSDDILALSNDIIWTWEDDEGRFLNSVQLTGNLGPEVYWPNPSHIPYDFHNFNQGERDSIKDALEAIEWRTGDCLTFKPRTNETEYIFFKGRKGVQPSCMADVGRTRGRVTSVVMHPLCLKATGIIQHEILHALGFLHEHSRPDRDDYVTVNASNIVPGIDPRNWVKLREMETFGLPYDLESVMHYGPEVSISPDRPAIVPRTTLLTRWMGQRRGLSSWDVAKLQIAYKCNRFEGPLRSLDSSRTNTPELDVDVKTFTASFYLLPNGSYDPQLQQPVVWWQDNSFSGWYGTAAANPLLSPAIVTCLALLMAA